MSDKTFRVDLLIKKFVENLKALNWKNPRVILTAIALGLIPFVAKYLFFTGLAIGLMLAIAVLWLIDKSPQFVKDLVKQYPLSSDLILSTAAIFTVGTWFGHGLVLGIGAVSCGLFLSWSLPRIDDTAQQDLSPSQA